jgi:hypothetical protein
MTTEAALSSSTAFGAPAGSEQLDLNCEREGHTTVHILRWSVDRQGGPANKTCTCRTCASGANTRPWPTKLELQDAGAPSSVPRSDDIAGMPVKSLSLSVRLGAQPQ